MLLCGGHKLLVKSDDGIMLVTCANTLPALDQQATGGQLRPANVLDDLSPRMPYIVPQ